MEKTFLPLILLLLILTLACGTANGRYDGEELADDDDGGVQYEKIDDFTWTAADGGEIDLYSLEGNVVLLNVGAGWCVACREETPSLQSDIWQRFQDENFVLLQLLVEDSNAAPAGLDFAREWRDQYGLGYLVGIDPDWSLLPYFIEETLPFNMILDAELQIRFRAHEYDAEAFALTIEDLL